jgi:hypothetical protein
VERITLDGARQESGLMMARSSGPRSGTTVDVMPSGAITPRSISVVIGSP